MLQLPTSAAKRSTPPADPIFALIERHAALKANWLKLSDDLEEAEYAAREVHGNRPIALIAWRNYSHIGGAEIDDRREEFLRLPGISPAKIEAEYRDAKARERAARRAETAWDKRAGLSELREQLRLALQAAHQLETRLGRTKPTTPAGAAALLQHVINDDLCAEVEWHVRAIKTAIAALNSMGAR